MICKTMQKNMASRLIETEHGIISMWLILFLGLTPILLFMLIISVMYWPASSPPSEVSAQETEASESSISADLEKDLKAITKGGMSNYVKITRIAEKKTAFDIEIELLSDKPDNEQAKKWSKVVCEKSVEVLKAHEIKNKDIRVTIRKDKTILGQTVYSQKTGKFQYKSNSSS